MAQVKGIKIICHGMYYYKTETAKGTKPYEHEVRAPSLEMFSETTMRYMGVDEKGNAKYSERSYINIRGQLKKRLLPILLGRKFNDFARVKFVTIDEIISESGEDLDLPITLRSKKQLSVMINKEKIPIDVNDYLDIDEIRSDILEYTTDPEAFMKNKVKNDRKRNEEKQFIEMNDLHETLPPVKKIKASAVGIADL